jgi:predicted nucleic acid-binding protein
MRAVVADTGPLNYLVQIDAVELLPKLFGRIIVPAAVRHELSHPRSLKAVRAWIATPPAWLEIRPNPDDSTDRAMSRSLDEGERATITLAGAIGADLILVDDRDGVAVARAQGFAVTGTLGVLDSGWYNLGREIHGKTIPLRRGDSTRQVPCPAAVSRNRQKPVPIGIFPLTGLRQSATCRNIELKLRPEP